MRNIIVMATMDTKGVESAYLAERILRIGTSLQIDVIVVDVGIRGEAIGITPDIDRYAVAEAGGHTMDEVRNQVRGDALAMMCDGAKQVVKNLYAQGRCDGIVSLCGGSGGSVVMEAMEVLPVGIPKIMTTPLASGSRPFEFYVKSKDIMIMHSVIDIIGVNSVSRVIYDNLADAIVGTVAFRDTSNAHDRKTERKAVSVTMLGNTTDGITVMKSDLEKKGYEVACFHSSGVGGRAMEAMVEDGYFDAVIDYTTNEIFEDIIGGLQKGCGPKRMTVAGRLGVPQVIVPGCCDVFDQGPIETVPPEIANKRKLYKHSPAFTLCKLTHEEMIQVAEIFAEKLNASTGPVAVVIPLKGFSIPGCPGGIFEDFEGVRLFADRLKFLLSPTITYKEVDAHINDENFAHTVADVFFTLMQDDNAQ